MGKNNKKTDEIIDYQPFYEDLLPPETEGFIINGQGCVIMNVQTLFEVINDEIKADLMKTGYFSEIEVESDE